MAQLKYTRFEKRYSKKCYKNIIKVDEVFLFVLEMLLETFDLATIKPFDQRLHFSGQIIPKIVFQSFKVLKWLTDGIIKLFLFDYYHSVFEFWQFCQVRHVVRLRQLLGHVITEQNSRRQPDIFKYIKKSCQITICKNQEGHVIRHILK